MTLDDSLRPAPPPSAVAPLPSASSDVDSALSSSHPLHLLLGSLNSLPKALLGWPLDTSKTLLQTTPASTYPPPFRTLRVLTSTAREHGLGGLYRGVSTPAAGWAVVDAVVLGGLWRVREALFERGWREEGERGERLTLGGHVLAGSVAGLMVVPIAHPIDHVKNKLQYQLRLSPPAHIPLRTRRLAYPPSIYATTTTPSLFPGFFTPSTSLPSPCRRSVPFRHRTRTQDGLAPSPTGSRSLSLTPALGRPKPTASPTPFGILSTILRESGLRGLYHGIAWTTACRSGMGIMFGSYELLLRAQEGVLGASGGEGGWARTGRTFVAGAVSALVFWSVILPADNVKAVLLTDSHLAHKRRFPTSASAIKHIYAISLPSPASSSSSSSSAGSIGPLEKVAKTVRRLKPFWRGGGAVVVRASVVNGLGLVLWEGAMRAVGETTLS